jgi:hypothetical protein
MKFNEARDAAVAMFGEKSFIEKIKEEDPLMVKYIPLLQKINKAGFLTTNSQAGNRSRGKHFKTGKPYELVERAYLEGFMLETDAAKFIKSMGINTDKNAIFRPVGVSANALPSELDIPLTITKMGSSTTVITHTTVGLPKEWSDSFKKMAHLNKSEKVVFILCWDTHWGRSASGKSGLFTQVIDCLRS